MYGLREFILTSEGDLRLLKPPTVKLFFNFLFFYYIFLPLYAPWFSPYYPFYIIYRSTFDLLETAPLNLPCFYSPAHFVGARS